MVRDLRAIAASFEKKWRESPAVMDNRDIPSQQSFITIDQRVNAFLQDNPLGISIKRLYNSVQTKTIENMYVVKAEELCKNPKQVMQGVYKFIEEPYCEIDYENVKQVTVENDRISDFGIYGDHKIQPNIKLQKKDFDEILTPGVANNIKTNYKWFYEAFNYF
jgi:hypothetical protein